jgi:hypothetical protein
LDLSDSTLFVWLGAAPISESVSERLVTATIASSPSAVLVAGGSAEVVFDRLLRALSVTTLDTMTSFETGSVADALTDFFHATWPSEDRFDKWRKYVVTSHLNECDLVRQRLVSFLEQRSD